MQYPAILAIALLMAAPALAFASDVEIVDVETKGTVVFLTGSTCAEDVRARLQSQMPDYWVVCAWRDGGKMAEPNVAYARMHYAAFEKLFYVVYVQDSYYELTKDYPVAGIAFGTYAISIDYYIVVEHERLHLVCQCYKTPDKYHD
jgi:hypothetical protein